MGLDNSHVRMWWAGGHKGRATVEWVKLQWMQIGMLWACVKYGSWFVSNGRISSVETVLDEWV